MLKDRELEKILKPVLELYSNIENELLVLIASKFDLYDEIGGSLEWWIRKLDQMGQLNEESIQIISSVSGKSEEYIKKSLEKVGYDSIDWDTYNKAYELGVTNVDPKNINLSNVIQARVDEALKQVSLIRTSAIEGTNLAYRQILDAAYLETSTGLYDYRSSVKRAMERMADKGITAATYLRSDGREVSYSIEGVVRRNIMSELIATAGKSNEFVAEELNAEYYATSQHIGARNTGIGHQNHESWQNRIFKRVGQDEEHPNFNIVTGYGLVDGLCGVNCRHLFWPYFPGISSPLPTDIDAKENARIYALEQRQRYLERKVRDAKRRLSIAEELKDEDMIVESKQLLRNRQVRVKEFVKSNPELKRDYDRERTVKSPLNINEHIVGHLDIDKFNSYGINPASSEVILLPERAEHIIKRHPGVLKGYKDKLDQIVKYPDEVYIDKKPNTLLLWKKFETSTIQTVIKLNPDVNSKLKNSIITMFKLDDKTMKRIKKNRMKLF